MAKDNDKAEATGLKLMTAAKIREGITQVGKFGAQFSAAVHLYAVQTIMHAEKHGDATLADELVKTVRESTPGYVWQGLVLWYKANSPITWDKDGKVSLLKPGEKGYKPFDVANADAKPAGEAAAVKARTDRPIEPLSIGYFKGQFKRFMQQAEKADEAGGRGFYGDTPEVQQMTKAATLAWLRIMSETAEKISVVQPVQQDNAPKAKAEAEGRKVA